MTATKANFAPVPGAQTANPRREHGTSVAVVHHPVSRLSGSRGATFTAAAVADGPEHDAFAL